MKSSHAVFEIENNVLCLFIQNKNVLGYMGEHVYIGGERGRRGGGG